MGPDTLWYLRKKKNRVGHPIPPNFPPGPTKRKVFTIANHFSFLLYPVRHWFGPHPMPTSQIVCDGVHGVVVVATRQSWRPKGQPVEVSRLWVEFGSGGCPDCNMTAAPECFISPSLLLYLVPVHRPSCMVYVHQMAHCALLGLKLLIGGHC